MHAPRHCFAVRDELRGPCELRAGQAAGLPGAHAPGWATLAPHCVPWHRPPGQVWCSAGVVAVECSFARSHHQNGFFVALDFDRFVGASRPASRRPVPRRSISHSATLRGRCREPLGRSIM